MKRFNGLKSNTGDDTVPELSADAFIKSLMDAWEENGESIYPQQAVEFDESNIPNLEALAKALEEIGEISGKR